jgi:hypothetical protein
MISRLLALILATISSPKVSSPNKKLLKLCRVVYVSNCPQEHSEKLIIHMEKFGDLFDYGTANIAIESII